MAPLSILIVGYGVAGPTLASFLLAGPQAPCEKPRITILERSSSPRPHGQNVGIRGAGVTVMRKLGIEGVVRASTTGEVGVQSVDSKHRVWAASAADKSGKIQTGTSDIETLRGCLAQVCCRRSQAVSEEVKKEGGSGVEHVFGDYLEALEQDDQQAHVRFAKSGEKKSLGVVVGADGLQSRTRRMVFAKEGEEERVKRLGMYAGFFSMPRGANDSEWRRWFHTAGREGVMVRPATMKDRATVFMYVINEQDAKLRDVAAMGHKGVESQKALLAEYYQDAGWECGRIIREMDAADDFCYDMVAQVEMDEWSKGRAVLLGDAGYCVSPVSGMGTTLGLSGAYNPAGALTHHADDLTTAFAAYDQSMRPLVERAQKLPLGGKGFFLANPESAWGIWIMHIIFAFLHWSGLANLIFRLGGPPANAVPVQEYGFGQLDEWRD